MSGPVRVRLSRAAGWRLPPNTVVVSRPTRWGNAFKIGQAVRDDQGHGLRCTSPDEVVAAFRAIPRSPEDIAEITHVLGGQNLACWCPLDEPCHADVLLEIANR